MAKPISLTYTADMRDLERKLASVSGVTQAEARKMTRELTRSISAAEKASVSAAKETETAWNRAARSMSSTASSLNSLTGPVGIVAGAIGAAGVAAFHFASELSEAVDQANFLAASAGLSVETVGALEYALGGAGVTVDQFRTSLTQFNTKLADNEAALNDLGVATRNANGELRSTDDILLSTFDALAGIDDAGARAAASADLFGARGAALAGVMQGVNADLERGRELAATWYGPEAQQASADMDRAMRDLQVAVRDVKQEIGEGLAPKVREFSLGAVWAFTAVDASVEEFTTRAAYNIQALDAVLDRDWERLGTIKDLYSAEVGFESFYSKIAAQADAAAAASVAAGQAAAASAPAPVVGAPPPSGGGRRSAPATAATPAITEAQRAQASALADLTRLTDRYAESTFKAHLATLDPLARVEEEYARIREQVVSLALEAGDMEAAQRAAAEVGIAYEAARAEALAEVAAGLTEVATIEGALADVDPLSWLDTASERIGAVVDGVQGFATGLAGLSEVIASNAEEGSEAHRRAAMVAFRATQASALAGIAMRTQEAFVAALTVPPPGGQILAGVALASGALAAATVAAQKPPVFHTGGLIGSGRLQPDEVYRGTRGEAEVGVLSPQGLEAANRGQAPGQITVVQMYQHRAYGAFVQDNLRLPNGALRSAIREAPRGRVGHRER